MPDFSGNAVNWEALGKMEGWENLSDLWLYCNTGDVKAKNTGLLVLQSKGELLEYLDALAPLKMYSNRRRANQVARHVVKAAEALAKVREEYRKLPATFMKVYEPEIMAARGTSKKKPLDLTK